MNLLAFIALFFICVSRNTNAQVFYLTAPSTFRLDSDEVIAVAVEESALVNVYIQDYPGKIKNITQSVFQVRPGSPYIFKVNLNPADFPEKFLATNPTLDKFVILTIHSDKFHKEVTIPIKNQAGYVFIQTDKPIYTPKQRAQIRIIYLDEDVRPSDKPFKLQIRNPQDIVVVEKLFEDRELNPRNVFETYQFKFPSYPVKSIPNEWSAVVSYGYQMKQNATVHFKLQEYVLPTFTVELQTPDVILQSDKSIDCTVQAKYVYGKKVNGFVTYRLAVQGDAPEAVFFATFGPKELVDGSNTLRIDTKELADHNTIGWFPEIEGSHLVVEATIMDSATGNTEVVRDAKSRFSKTPFVISFKRCLQDFKPGLVSVVEADINYVDGRPAPGISTVLKAVASGEELKVTQTTDTSDEEGKVSFEIHPEIHHDSISITVEIDDQRYVENRAVGHFIQYKYNSKNKAYIAIERSSTHKLKVGDVFTKNVHFEPAEIQNAYYTVSSKGKIILQEQLQEGQFINQRVVFPITHEMVPSFRITVFSHYLDELLVDSLNIDIEHTCHPEAQVSIDPEFSTKEPGYNGKIIIRGTKNTRVGLLGVDEAVYAMSKKDLLTRSKVFKSIAKHDLGCGPGGGITTDTAMANAGLIILTNIHTPSATASSCVAIKRRKRAVASEILRPYNGLAKECCSLGMSHDALDRTCETRTEIVKRFFRGESQDCSQAFLECCKKAEEQGLTGIKLKRPGLHLARMGVVEFDEPEYLIEEDEEEFENGITVIRSYFIETWFSEDKTIGPDGKEVFDVSLPHSITTWVIQAVSVSPQYGICVAEPQKIVSTKKVFLQLNLPYSVVRNEQVEVQATLFNYGNKKLNAVVYMYGVKNLCTGVNPGEKSERKRVTVEPESAKSITFPVIPLDKGQFVLDVVALSPDGSDRIKKNLNVIPEGNPDEIDISIKLDPTNQQKRQERRVTEKHYEDFIDSSQNMQVTAIKLPIPKDFVPGTESCTITAIGDQFGPTVDTAINNPDSLLTKPRGCGEQNMMFLAPTLYTMRYLKTSGKVTPEIEEKGYDYIRLGYSNQLAFRKEDGSFAAYQQTPTSSWLTAFVMKVFCQANELIHIDENVICSGIKWLVSQQHPDGSFKEEHPVYHLEMMGGVKGQVPMTAFVLIALEECDCDVKDLHIVKKRAMAYLENNLGEVKEPLPLAVVSYALSLSQSEFKNAANDRLLSMARYDQERNLMHWGLGNSAQDIEATSYALLNQILFNDMSKSNSIVNWLNTLQLQSGSFKSTQDTMIALQALSEYAIRAQMPAVNLITNITSGNDRNFRQVLHFNEENAHVLRDIKINKVGGKIFVSTGGHGVGYLSVKLRYNINKPADQLCKFDVRVNATEIKKEKENIDLNRNLNHHKQDLLPDDLIRAVQGLEPKEDNPVLNNDPRNRTQRASLVGDINFLKNERRVKRDNNLQKSKLILKVQVCARYLGNKTVDMSIIDVGIFSGFEPDLDDLRALQHNGLIERYEKSSKGVVFYLRTIPSDEDFCLHFHVIREYVIGNTRISVVKVYDYYNPDEACSAFYSPGKSSPLLHTICEGGVCQCAEGGCPPESPFETLSKKAKIADRPVQEIRRLLTKVACENYDFVWKGKLNGEIKRENGFFNISFKIEKVIKEGTEKADMIQNETKHFLARDICNSAVLHPDVTYIIMSMDGQKYMNDDGHAWYRYLLDKKSAIYLWTEIDKATDKNLQRGMNHLENKLPTKGCDL